MIKQFSSNYSDSSLAYPILPWTPVACSYGFDTGILKKRIHLETPEYTSIVMER